VSAAPTPQDLQGIDTAWIAADVAGHVALFTTAGQGPVPELALAGVLCAEELVLDLAEITDAVLVVSLPRPDSFVAFAKRGLFAYDWSDVHRTVSRCLNGYEPIARPCQPMKLEDLPLPLQKLAEDARLTDTVFADGVVIHI